MRLNCQASRSDMRSRLNKNAYSRAQNGPVGAAEGRRVELPELTKALRPYLRRRPVPTEDALQTRVPDMQRMLARRVRKAGITKVATRRGRRRRTAAGW